MRTFLSAVAGLVAVVALAAALPIGWVANHVASEDGYVAFTSDLVKDPTFRADVVQVVTDDVIARAGVSDSFAPRVRQALDAAASRVVAQPAFATAFADAQRQSHRAVFGDARTLSPELDTSDRLVIDLAPVAATIIDALTQDLPVTVSPPEQLLVTVGGSNQRQAIEAVDRTPQQTVLLAGVAAVAAGISLLAARRRSTTTAWLGAGAILAAGAVHVAADQAVSYAIERNTAPSQVANRAQQLLADAAMNSFDRWLVIVAIAGAALVVVGLIGRAVTGRAGPREA